jgi:hypothetical protein
MKNKICLTANQILSVVVTGALGLLISSPTLAFNADLPNPSITPGALNPDVNQQNIQSTVCVKGFTKTIRPPSYFTNKLKKQQIEAYGYGDKNPKNYEEDHLIPLSVGGAPSDPRNLWPQPRGTEWSAEKKDQLEFALYKAVCRQEITLDAAQKAFSLNWIESYKKYDSFLRRYKGFGN